MGTIFNIVRESKYWKKISFAWIVNTEYLQGTCYYFYLDIYVKWNIKISFDGL